MLDVQPSPFMVLEELKLARPVLSDQYVEKGFLYLLVLSLALHAAGFAVVYLWPKESQKLSEPTFIDLQDMPELKPTPKDEIKARPSDQRRRVAREAAPRGDMQVARPIQPSARQRQQTPPPGPAAQDRRPGQALPPTKPVAPGSSVNELIRRQPTTAQQAPSAGGGGATTLPSRLMPSASRMAKLEESYRRRYADEIAEGDTAFFNTNDILLGSFLSRFESAVYGVWRYPQEAAIKGIEGVTPVRITFNRKGEIVKVRMLESSGSKLLDDEVMRTLRVLGPLGGFPKNYPKDEFHLIAFFYYGNARGRLR